MSEAHDPEITLLLPCLDEAETVERCVLKALDGLRRAGAAGEVLVADNGSTDGSDTLAAAAGARVVAVAARGYGAALLGGIAAARGRYVIMADADDSYDWSRIGPFIDRLRAGADFVMGCRLPSGGGTILPGAMPFLHRWLGNPLLSFIGRLLFRAPVTDFHCGMRGFRRAAIDALELRTTGMELASEMVIRASLAGLRIEEVPITLHPDGRSRPPHLRTWSDGWRHLRFMLLLSPRWVFQLPGALMLALGLLGFALLLPGPLTLGRLTLDTNTLLVASVLTLLGAQWVAFGVFAAAFAADRGLLPESAARPRWVRRIRLEHGLAAGLFVLLVGAGLLADAAFRWSQLGFGSLPRAQGLRLVIPSVTLLALGGQTILASFLMSLLGLPMRSADR